MIRTSYSGLSMHLAVPIPSVWVARSLSTISSDGANLMLSTSGFLKNHCIDQDDKSCPSTLEAMTATEVETGSQSAAAAMKTEKIKTTELLPLASGRYFPYNLARPPSHGSAKHGGSRQALKNSSVSHLTKNV